MRTHLNPGSRRDQGVLGGAPIAFAIELQTLPSQDRVEELPMALQKYEISWRG